MLVGIKVGEREGVGVVDECMHRVDVDNPGLR